MIKVVIADDQELLRKSLGQIIGISEDIEVLALAENGREAIEICEDLKPDILMLDIEMPIMNGIDALKIIKEDMPSVKVIILTTFDNPDYILDSFLYDADAYLSKDIAPDELILSIKCVNSGLLVIDNNVKRFMQNKLKTSKKSSDLECLSEEEIEIIKLIVNGMSNQKIAGELNYSQGTVKNKIGKIYDKLEIDDRLQLAVYAVENGL